jgi:hypothetical protein
MYSSRRIGRINIKSKFLLGKGRQGEVLSIKLAKRRIIYVLYKYPSELDAKVISGNGKA